MVDARIATPNSMRMVQEAMRKDDDVLSIPNSDLDRVLGGVDSRLPTFSEKSAKIENTLDGLESQAFVQAFESLKGAGAITEKESEAATRAIAQLNRIMSPESYKEAVKEAKRVFQSIYESASQRAGIQPENFVTPDPVGGEFSGFKIKGVK